MVCAILAPGWHSKLTNLNCSDLGNGTDPGSTAPSLIRGVKALDPGAWQQLATVYGPLVYGWARRAGLCGDDAADVTQEVFRVVATRPQQLQHGRPGDTFRGWHWTITRNKVRDFWRGRADHPAAIGGSDARDMFLLVPENNSNSSLSPPDSSLRRAVEIIRT